MNCDIPIVFSDNPYELCVPEAFVASIPSGVSNRPELFREYQKQLSLPQYFGENWDALSECLRDLSWIQTKRVVIVHETLPSLDDASLKTYLEVIVDCVRDWKPTEDHELTVVFPANCEEKILRILCADNVNKGRNPIVE